MATATPAEAFHLTLDVRFRDLDALGHVNHATYLTYMETARVAFFEKAGIGSPDGRVPFIIARCEVDYRAPIQLGTRVDVAMWTSRMGGKSWDFAYRLTDAATGAVFAEGLTVQVSYDYDAGQSLPMTDDLRAFLVAAGPANPP